MAPAGGLILASRSPQRRAILDQLGIPFEVAVSDIEELVEGPPGEVAAENAYRKAAAAATTAGARLVLGVDTIVTLGGRIYGKPVDAEDARKTLRALGGRSHAVMSGLCLIEPDRGRVRTAVSTTIVAFRALDERLIDWYVATGEWTGRAGGYAIQGQGASLVRSIDGDYLNVVGLPVATLLELAPELLWAL